MTIVTIIGRGHSGTRAISHTLSASGVFMGEPLNESGDLLPPEDMYRAVKVFSRNVKWLGGLQWDWTTVSEQGAEPEFKSLIKSYLATVLNNDRTVKGWKIPETTLVFPWIVELFPEIKYIFWIRNPRDCVIGSHITDDLSEWGIQYPQTENLRLRRAISWKYQYDLVKAMPKPDHWIEVRFEDFVLNQAHTLHRLEEFLGFGLATIPVKAETVGRWKTDQEQNYFSFFAPAMREYGYEIPEPG